MKPHKTIHVGICLRSTLPTYLDVGADAIAHSPGRCLLDIFGLGVEGEGAVSLLDVWVTVTRHHAILQARVATVNVHALLRLVDHIGRPVTHPLSPVKDKAVRTGQVNEGAASADDKLVLAAEERVDLVDNGITAQTGC